MKKILKLSSFILLIAMSFIACETTESDDPNAYPNTGGAILEVTGSGKLLGTPVDPAHLDTSEVLLTDPEAEMNITIDVPVGNRADGVANYQIVKSFNGTEMVVATSASLPFSFAYATVADFLDGMGVAVTDLRIGDQFVFDVKNVLNDGTITLANSYVITVNCLSDLAGTYTSSSNGTGAGAYTLTVSETQPGVYEGNQLPHLFLGGNPIPFPFSESCGTVTIDFVLNGTYLIQGTGVVNTDGSFTIGYILYHGSTVDTGIFFDKSGPADIVTYTP